MSKPLVVSIPHQLGRAEARRRLATGIGQLRHMFGERLTAIEDRWTGDHLNFDVRALGQSVSGQLDVRDDHVRLEVMLPWALAIFAQKAKGLIEKQGTLMLEKK
jgi:hypothetical protein